MSFVGLHIHKTAGTSLLRYLEKHVPLRLYGAYALRNYRLSELPLWASPVQTSRDIVWGHAIYESFFYDFAKPIQLFTFLRDPVERIASWYSMLKRRNKLKTPDQTLEAFALTHANSMSQMLVTRFPSLSQDTTVPLHAQALAVLEKMCFVGFQAHYNEHLPLLLQLMRVPICPHTLGTRHNKAKKIPVLEKSEKRLLRDVNEQDYQLYQHAFDRYAKNPVSPERKLSIRSFALNSDNDGESIRQKQLQAAQKKFVSALRLTLGEAGVEDYIHNLCKRYASCEKMLDLTSKDS